MKTLRISLVWLVLGMGLIRAQDATTPPSPDSAAPTTVSHSPQELEQLVAPIALYPDALIALILPASTAPADIVLAARYLRDSANDHSQIEHRAWDESVKSLTNYPDVLKWLDDNLDWTKQLGQAFADQPADVMQAVQRLRAQARAAGTLVDTPQQQIIAEPDVIRIVPAQADVIYVPRYEPEVVFVDRPVYYSQPFVSFGFGLPVGSWLAFDCDWRGHTIWVGDRHRRWTGHDWRRPLVPPPTRFVRSPVVHQWRPPPQAARASVSVAFTTRHDIVRPVPFGITGTRAYAPRPSTVDGRRIETSPGNIVRSSPRTYSGGTRAEANSSRITPPMATPANPSFAPIAPIVPPTTVVTAPATAAPVSRRGNTDWVREREARTRTFQAANSPISPPVTNAPTLHAGIPTQAPVVNQSHPSHVYSRVAPAPAGIVTPPMATMPAGVPAQAPVYNHSAPNHSYTHSAPAVPVYTPAAPPSAPVNAAPANHAPAPAPSNQAAPARNDPPSERHGHRSEN